MKTMKRKNKIILSSVLMFVLLCNVFLAPFCVSAESVATVKEYKELEAILYGKNDTGQSNAGSVSFHVDNVEGLGYIPCNGLTHDKKYTPDTTVEGSGLYRNGKLETDMYLATFCPSGSNQMQFVISWANTDKKTIEANDKITIRGRFVYVDGDTKYALEFKKAEFTWDGDDWQQKRIVNFANLDATLYRKNDTGQSNTGHSVSFHVDNVAGIGEIPCFGLTHDKKYTPDTAVEGSGLYRNGRLEQDMYLATFCPSGSNQMQFVIAWSDQNPIQTGDIISLQGSFIHQTDDGTQYVLNFHKAEFAWSGDDWKQTEIKTFGNLSPILYTKNDTGQSNTGSVSFHVDNVAGIGEIACIGGSHDKKYTPDTAVEGSGLYFNGTLKTDMYLATFYPSGSNQMQFVIAWPNQGAVQTGDVIKLQGSFVHETAGGTKYVLNFQKTEYTWDGSDWKVYDSNNKPTDDKKHTFDNLSAILYTKNDTSQSGTGSVSFHVDNVAGLGEIPCIGGSHDKKYTPDTTVEGSGLYYNDILKTDMYLTAFYPSGSNQMQFVIAWPNQGAVQTGDVIKLQGSFIHQTDDGTRYILNFNKAEYTWDGSDWKVYDPNNKPSDDKKHTFDNLSAILYTKNETGQSNTGSVSFHVDNVAGLGEIPCIGGSHDKKYTPDTTVEGSGLYYNDILKTDMYLTAFYPGGSNQMQFVIAWPNQGAVQTGDVIKLQGSFIHQTDDGTRYILNFNKAEYTWNGSDWEVYDPNHKPPIGQTNTFDNLEAVLYTKNETGQSNTGSVSFHVDNVDGIGEIPCNGLTHDKKYTPDQTVEGSGLYRNGKLETDMYLATFCPNGSNQMQFVISWQNTENTTVKARDTITLQGTFTYQDERQNTYVLNFKKIEFRWDGNDWKVYEKPVKPTQNTPEELGYKGLNLRAFDIAAGPYRGSDEPNYTSGTYTGKSLDHTYLDVDVQFALTQGQNQETSLRYLSANGWTGMQIGADENGLYVQDASVGIPTLYDIEQLGLNSMYEKFNLKIATKLSKEYLNEGGTSVRDITYSLWINNVLVVKDAKLQGVAQTGNKLGIYAPKGSITVSIPKENNETVTKKLPSTYRELTFKSFNLKDGKWGYTGEQMPTVKGTTVYSINDTVFSGDVFFHGGRGADLRYGCYDSVGWTGLQFYATQNGDIQMAGVTLAGYATETYKFRPYTAGVELTENWFNLKISIHFMDSDKDGIKDDVELGVWFNDVLYDNTYIYLEDYAQYLGSGLSTYVESSGKYIATKSDKSVYTGVDFTLYGFTRNWAKELGLK